MLTFLFSVRVAAQAVQHWVPQSWLPPFDAFQGSNLPYPLLLGSQVMIVAVMVHCNVRRPAGGRALFWLGGLYMTGSVLRIAVGLMVPSAPAWFSTWIPAAFHLVLAGYVLVLATPRGRSRADTWGR